MDLVSNGGGGGCLTGGTCEKEGTASKLIRISRRNTNTFVKSRPYLLDSGPLCTSAQTFTSKLGTMIGISLEGCWV